MATGRMGDGAEVCSDRKRAVMDNILRILEALAWPIAFLVAFHRAVAEWDDNRRRDRESRLERVRVRAVLHAQSAAEVAEITRANRPEPRNQRLERYGVQILETVVGVMGGIPGKESAPGQTSRGIVRELRGLMGEIETPTPPPADKRAETDMELDDLDRELLDDVDDGNAYAEPVEEDLL